MLQRLQITCGFVSGVVQQSYHSQGNFKKLTLNSVLCTTVPKATLVTTASTKAKISLVKSEFKSMVNHIYPHMCPTLNISVGLAQVHTNHPPSIKYINSYIFYSTVPFTDKSQ